LSRVLVVGGAGYVGGWLTDRLTEAGHDVLVYDLLLYEDVYLKPARFVYGDILDHSRLLPHVQWAEVVIWLSALVGDGACALDPALTQKINVESVGWLADNFDGRIVFMSTCSVYGAQDGELDEDSPLNPLSVYAETKLEAEQLLKSSDAAIFRLGTLYGVGDTYSRLRVDLVVNTLTIRAALNGRMAVFGGRQYRPLLHVRDVTTGILGALETGFKGIVNLRGENTTIIEIAEKVQQHIPESTIEITDTPFQDSRNYRVSGGRAAEQLGFTPQYDIDSGIRQVRELIEEGRIRDLTASRFSNYEALRPYLKQESSPLGRELHVAHQLAHHLQHS
jgi:nucleoside-diphosphate-sugar epimerase